MLVWRRHQGAKFAHGGDEVLLRAQFRALRSQIPFLYALLIVDACFLCFATYGAAPDILSFGFPAFLAAALCGRSIVWRRRGSREFDLPTIRRYLNGTVIATAALSVGFGGWGLMLFEVSDLVQRTCVGLYIFIGATSCAYCFQSFPLAGRMVLICGAAPIMLRLIATGDPFLIGLGVNLAFVLVLVIRLLSTNYAGFVELLASRTAVVAERERAQDAEKQAHRLAYHDPLTGLPNRRALGDHLTALMATRGELAGAGLLIVDLDRFKSVNDVHGHFNGDLLLREVSARLAQIVGRTGHAYRLGGDEFALLVDIPKADPDVPRRIAKSIVQGLSQPFDVGSLVHHIGASVGISLFPTDAHDQETLMRRADIALYRAKEGGRNQHRSFEPTMDAEIKRRSQIERDLRATILADGLRPYYQPIVSLATREISGFEVLARWPLGDAEEIGPDQFIPVAEESGLINQLMLQLLARGCVDALAWRPELTISVIISPVQLRDSWLSQKILATLAKAGFPPSRLWIEITENALIEDGENARRTIQSLKNQGVRIALDDFGTGYASLQHLHKLPFDSIKIDRSFVLALCRDPEALKIVRAITSLASSLDLPVVAEGIEDEVTLERLRELGCAFGQGFHLGRPTSAEQVLSELNARTASQDAGKRLARVVTR